MSDNNQPNVAANDNDGGQNNPNPAENAEGGKNDQQDSNDPQNKGEKEGERMDTMEDQKAPYVDINKDVIYVTNNDQAWADDHCIYILDKYVNHYDPKEEVDMDKHIWSIMKDLHVFFDIPENKQIMDEAYSRLDGKTVRPAEFFKNEIYKYIKSYRDLKLSEMQNEGLNVIDKTFTKKQKEIDQFFTDKKKQNQEYFKIDNLQTILADFMELTNVRLVCLDHSRPKDNLNVVTEEQETEFAKMLQKLFEANKLTEITSVAYFKSIINGYLKSPSTKYSFVYVPQIDDEEGLDPYADHGEVAPGEENKPKNNKALNDNIDQEIEEAEQANLFQKAQLLRKVKNLKNLKQYAGRVSEEESIDMMIHNTYKQIQNIEEIQGEGDFEEDGEGEGFYEGEDDNEFQSQRRKSQSHISRKVETLEELRDKGLKEIFDNYARSQLLIGKKATFEMIQHELSNLNLGEYMKFVKDFNIPCSKTKTAEVFKKIATNSKELYLDDFKSTLWKLFEMRDIEEIDKLKRRLREIRKIQKKRDQPEQNPVDSKPNSDLIDTKDQDGSPKKQVRISEDDDKKEDSEQKQNEEKSPGEPEVQTISRPKGGDPKNVETLKTIQNERKESQDAIGGSQDGDKTNPKAENNDDKNANKQSDEEINKKTELKTDNDDKNDSQDQPKGDAEEVDELEQEKQRILARIDELKQRDQPFYQEQILQYIECDNPRAYKIKSKGFMLPFGTRAKYDDTNQYKYKKTKNIDEIKAKVERLKKERQRRKQEEEAIKNRKYIQGQTAMKKMHEDILRDKGIMLSPGQPHPALMHNKGMAGSVKAGIGYKVPRKFTLESLSRMNYGDFTMPQANEYEDEFKPEDVLDSDDEIDEEIENMYQFKQTQSPHQHNSVLDLNPNGLNSPILPGSQKNRYQNNPINHTVAYQPPQNKNAYTSVPVSNIKKRNKNMIVNKSMASNIKVSGLNKASGRKYPNKNTSRTRGSSVHHSAINVLRGRSKSKPKSNMYGNKPYRNKSIKAGVHTDHSPNRNRIRDKLKIGPQAIKRTRDYDMKSKRRQEQKLNNVLRMHNYEAKQGKVVKRRNKL